MVEEPPVLEWVDDRGGEGVPWVVLPGRATVGLVRPCAVLGESGCAVVATHAVDGDVSGEI